MSIICIITQSSSASSFSTGPPWNNGCVFDSVLNKLQHKWPNKLCICVPGVVWGQDTWSWSTWTPRWCILLIPCCVLISVLQSQVSSLWISWSTHQNPETRPMTRTHRWPICTASRLLKSPNNPKSTNNQVSAGPFFFQRRFSSLRPLCPRMQSGLRSSWMVYQGRAVSQRWGECTFIPTCIYHLRL